MNKFKAILLALLLSVTAFQSFSQSMPNYQVNGSLKDECRVLVSDIEKVPTRK